MKYRIIHLIPYALALLAIAGASTSSFGNDSGAGAALSISSSSYGGNGAGNGTDRAASELALKNLMTDNGLSIEEKIYDLWVRSENSVPNIQDSRLYGRWFGLNVVNQGEKRHWVGAGLGGDYGIQEKHQKAILKIDTLPAIQMNSFVIKPQMTYGYAFGSGNFDGDMDPNNTFVGRVGSSAYLASFPYEGRMETSENAGHEGSIKQVTLSTSGMIVYPIENTWKIPPIEYRQLDEKTLVGVRKAQEGSTKIKPCPYARKVERKERQKVERTRSFLGFTYKTRVEEDVYVFDHWEMAPDYGVPGVCEVHYLIKAD